ncbi:MAG: glucuronyl hydrolase [Bacteroidetes bacterium]|nr:MAG: glucuronyl hydrolase [Bacteroidota bacterium]
MKHLHLILPIFFFLFLFGCKTSKQETNAEKVMLTTIQKQYDILVHSSDINLSQKNNIPRTVKNGKTIFVSPYDWTSGFFPGSLWYLYDLTNDEKWKTKAIEYTETLDTIQYWGGNHDVGFMIECSYGNALKNINSKAYEKIIVQTAKSLSTRFHPKAGIIQSWDAGKKWNCPVIIDNMMNLELLFHASKISKDPTYYNIAVTHADTTLKNHFRQDNSSYHVLNYNTETGEVLDRNTHQGYTDGSAWARGQAWGLYGFTVTYRETKDPKYLQQAIKIANFIMTHPQLPTDKIPYWDYDVSKTDTTPRDASAAAITASALYELSIFVSKKEKNKYTKWADTIMKNLKSPVYLAEDGKNNGFLLYHSVGSLPHKSEIDVPLNYADYYFLEALFRSEELK